METKTREPSHVELQLLLNRGRIDIARDSSGKPKDVGCHRVHVDIVNRAYDCFWTLQVAVVARAILGINGRPSYWASPGP